MMKHKLLYLILAVILLAALAAGPASAQGPITELDLDATLARAAAKSFLVTLTRPDLASTQAFYLADAIGLDHPVLAQLKADPVSGFSIDQAGWLDDDTFQVAAALQPGSRTLLITTANYNGRWRVDSLELIATPAGERKPAAGAATTAATQPARANGLGGQLVFQTRNGGDIYLINADGSGLRRLTHGLDPQLSPDSSKVAFTRWEPRYELFTINTDGTGETGLVSGWRQMKAPTWSADGTSLVFSFQSGGRLNDEQRSIDLAEAAREGDAPDIPSEARDVEVEDGQIKYRLPMDANWHLKQFNLQTTALEDLPAGQYSYSPFGHPTEPNLLLYTVGGRGIALYDDASQTTRPVTTDPNDRAPALSPDGTKVAVSYDQGGHWEIHTFNLDGSNRQRLTQTPLSVLAERTALRTEEVAGKERAVAPEQPHWNNAAPAWSPDGSQIAFMTDRTGQWEIWVMNADGTNQRPMFPNGELAQLDFEYAGVDEHMLSWR